jgi:hypothetical protein
LNGFSHRKGAKDAKDFTFEDSKEQKLEEIGFIVAASPDPKTQTWRFEIWEMIPGPGPNDFIVEFASRDGYINAVYDFHFGHPTDMEGWLVPFHKHPELSIDAVRHAITEAVNVSHEAFKGIEERRYNRIAYWYYRWISGNSRWARSIQFTFLEFPHVMDTTRVLKMRRDCQETYIVHR